VDYFENNTIIETSYEIMHLKTLILVNKSALNDTIKGYYLKISLREEAICVSSRSMPS